MEILDIAQKVYEQDQQQMVEHNKFKDYIVPIVRERFNLPKFEIEYRYMVASEIQDFTNLEEKKIRI